MEEPKEFQVGLSSLPIVKSECGYGHVRLVSSHPTAGIALCRHPTVMLHSLERPREASAPARALLDVRYRQRMHLCAGVSILADLMLSSAGTSSSGVQGHKGREGRQVHELQVSQPRNPLPCVS